MKPIKSLYPVCDLCNKKHEYANSLQKICEDCKHLIDSSDTHYDVLKIRIWLTQIIIKFIINSDLTQKGAATELGLTQPQTSRLYDGKYTISTERLIRALSYISKNVKMQII